MALTDRQQRFVDEYLIDLNATRAAIRAGYGRAGAQVQGSRLLSNAMVSEAIKAGQAKLATVTRVTKEWLVAELVETFAEAKAKGDRQARARLGDLLARMHGHIMERRLTRVITSLEDLGDDELAAIETEAMRREGIGSDYTNGSSR